MDVLGVRYGGVRAAGAGAGTLLPGPGVPPGDSPHPSLQMPQAGPSSS